MTSARTRTILVVSLALNLLLAGAIGGAALMWANLSPQRGARGQPTQEPAGRLSPEHRQAFQAALRTANRSVKDRNDDAHEQRRLAATLLAQPQFDPAAVNAALERARSDDFAVRAQLEQAVVAFAVNLSAQERASLSESLKGGGPRREPDPFKRRGGPAFGPKPRPRDIGDGAMPK
jgi:uncharacterized membrane protein